MPHAQRMAEAESVWLRPWLLVVAGIVGFGLSCVLVASVCGAGEPLRPNIVFILADDLGYGDLSCYGQDKISTPNIDRLAEEGLRFTDYYAGATICAPSRCTLLTGLHTGHARIRGNVALAGGLIGYKGNQQVRRANLTASDRTIADALRAAGYRNCLVGKWHLDGFDPAAGPLDHGFDEFYGWLVSAPSTADSLYYPAERFDNRRLYEVSANHDGKRGYYDGDLCVDEATDFVKRNAEAPFFLCVAFNLPHSPLEAPDLGPYASKDWPTSMKTYAAMIDHLDRAVGRIEKSLEELNLERRTIVFFSSDNGPRSEPTEQLTSVAEFFDSKGPLRGYKRDMTEGGIRVPLIVRWPGQTKAGSTTKVPAYSPDILATLAELAGAEAGPETDGVSLVPTLRGEKQGLTERLLYWEDFERGFRQAARWGKWKVIRPERNADLELYDLSSDIAEEHNVAAEYPDVVARLEQLLSNVRTESENWPLEALPADGELRRTDGP